MKKILLFLLVLVINGVARAQNEDAAGAITLTPVALSAAASLAASGCQATLYNLGLSTSPQTPAVSSGTMSNDVWFKFVAVAEVAKIKVCSPTTFDAAIEVWNNAATGVAIASANVGGSGAKEYLCATGLTIGTTYKVRVGRVSGSGAGTFNISYEHLGVEIRSGFYLGSPGAPACYNFTMSIQRTFITFAVGSTRWKFIDELGNVFGPYTLGYSITLSQCPGVCEGHTYQVYCELQATDAECGTIYWGYSVPRTIVTCAANCPTITANSLSCGTTFCNIFNTDFQASFLGTGFEYQFKFITDNGSVEFCSAWSTSPIFSTSQSPYIDYFRYGKIYQVYVRARKCNADPPWCGPCVYSTCSMPYVSVSSTSCCKWRNKSGGGVISATPVVGMDQYRFRFTPISISPCLANPLTPQGPAVTTGWSNSFSVNPSGIALILGTVYNVQVQARVLASNLIQCDASVISLSGQQVDWGPVCLIGIRSSSSPAVGTALGCYCLPGMEMEEEYLLDENYRNDESFDVTSLPSILSSVNENSIVIDPAGAGLSGNGVLRVFNMNGQLVLSKNLYAMENSTATEIITENLLPTGIYIISVQSDSGYVSDKVFIRSE